MNRVRNIPYDRRCRTCAGFGYVYRTNEAETEIIRAACGDCEGTGKLTPAPDRTAS